MLSPSDSSPTLAFEPLSEGELDELDELLRDHSPLDLDGLLGVLHAVAVAPGHISRAVWTSAVLPSGGGRLDLPAGSAVGPPALAAERCIDLMRRLHHEVVVELERGATTMIPPEDDLDGCKSFASGYATGAALDPLWRGDDNRWTFASCFAYLADRRDLIPVDTLAKLDAVGDARDTLRRQADGVVLAARDSFLGVPTTPAPHAHTPPPAPARKAPCPCGSGKKFKRCCADRPRTHVSR